MAGEPKWAGTKRTSNSYGRSAGAAVSVGDQAGEIDLGGSVHGVAAGLPGSESASVAANLSGAWQQRLSAWAADIRSFGESVSASADEYAASDQAAEEAFNASLWERLGSWF
ncbi:MAG: hypothetical protein LC799_27990 [Actinobacteria bacterium]|nr:hypothetical protein [Actinomycetota bacterium]